MTQLEIEPRSPRPLANTLSIMIIYIYIYIYIYVCVWVLSSRFRVWPSIEFCDSFLYTPFFLGCGHPQMIFQACQIAANFTTDWALSIVSVHMNVMMRNSKLDMFAHMAFKTSTRDRVFYIFHNWLGDFVRPYELIICKRNTEHGFRILYPH